MVIENYSKLTAVFINCSIGKDVSKSHTQKLMDKVSVIMKNQGVTVTDIYARSHQIATGMIKDGAEQGEADEWPDIQRQIVDADILVIGTPVWLGDKSSVASKVIERLYAYSSDTNDKNQYVYYNKVGGAVVTGNEDGVKNCSRDITYSLGHIGYTIPPQPDAGWLGAIGPGPSYGDTEYAGKKLDAPAGFDSDFTNKAVETMAWNLMHMAHLLKSSGGIPAIGNTTNK